MSGVSHDHGYQCRLLWAGSTSAGYDEYTREHRVTVPPATAEFALSSDLAFRGDGSLANPEQLLLASASSCQLLSFLAVAARRGIDIRGYEDDAEAVMPGESRPQRITRIVLRPHITVAAGTATEIVLAAVARAHEECYVANTLNAEMIIETTVVHAPVG